jgi:hypothetical protein
LATQSGTWTVQQGATPTTVANAWPVKLTDGTNTAAVKAASTAPVATDPAEVVTLSPNSSLPPPSDLIATGTLTSLASSPVVLTLNGAGSVNVDVSGSGFVGTIMVQETYASSSRSLSVLSLNSSAAGSSITANGNYRVFGVPSAGTIQVLFTAYTSGSANISIRSSTAAFYTNPMNFNASNLLMSSWLSDGSGNAISSTSGSLNVNVTDTVPVSQSGTWTVQQGSTPTAVANAWPIKVTDGTNTATIRAGSSQPLLTDNAIVVTQRPDNMGTVTQTSVSCASISTTLLAANAAAEFVAIRNPTNSTQTIWVQFNGSAATAAVPSIDLPPGSEIDFFAEGASFLPTSQMNCISGGTASSVAVFYK